MHFSASAQNCTVNANGDQTICPNQPFLLQGSYSGSTSVLPVWTQIGGPAITLSGTTASGGSATATVTGYSPGGVYKFRLSSKCVDGTPIKDDVTYTVSTLTVANAGTAMVTCPGTVALAANAPNAGAGEIGTWSVVSGNIVPPSTATGNITLGTSDNTVGTSVLRWTITSSGGTCSTTSTVSITNLGGVTPVTATSPLNVSCYTVTGSVQLNGSYGGSPTETRQRGTWSLISGPNTPVFANVNVNNTTISNLIQGTYVVRWTVAGQCVNGSADVTINVAAASQNVTNVGNTNIVYCDGRTSTVLTGVNPLYSGETVQWVQASGPTTATFSSTTSPTTAIGGLNGSGTYKFTYTITNPFSCTSSGTYQIDYTIPPAINISIASPQVLSCGVSSLSIPYTVSGGNGTQWELVSAPAGATIDTAAATGGFNHFNNATSSTQVIVGMNLIGTYVIRFKRYSNNASGGCSDAFADITIIVSKAPYTALAGTPQFLACGVTSTALAGNLPLAGQSGTGSWSQVSGPNTAIFADKTLNTSGISNLISGVYTFRWTVTGGELQCGDTQSDVNVIEAVLPTVVNAGTNINTCFGTVVKLGANTPQADETGTWSFISASPSAAAPTFANIHDPSTTTTGYLANEAYTLRWTISNSCGSITSDVIVNTSSTNGPKQATASTDQCLSSGSTSFTLAGNSPSVGETGTWTLLTGAPNTPTFTASQFNTPVTGAINGTYTFEWKLDRGGCTTTRDTVVITISPTTTVASITGGAIQNVCGLSPITLIGNAPAATETGTWTQTAGPGGAVITSPNSTSTTVTGVIAGLYTFTWTISNKACSSSSASVTYTFDDTPTTAVAGSNQTLCDATSTTLAGNAITTGTGLWSIVSGPNSPTFSSVSSPTSTISGLTLGTYTLKWTSSNGAYCTPSTSTMTITVNQSANAGTTQLLCNQTTTVLIGNEGSTGTWIQTAGPNSATVSTNSNNTAIATGLIAGTYTFQYTMLTNNCGSATASVNVTVSPPPSIANAGTDQQICTLGNPPASVFATLAATAPGAGSSGVWSILSKPTGSSPSFSSTTLNNANLNNLSAGTYLLQWTVTSVNCTGTTSSNDIVRIDVYDPPTTALAMAAQPVACTGHIDLTGTTPLVGVGTWTEVSGPTVATIDAPNSPTTHISGVVAANATAYVFRWTITNGSCASSHQDVSVTVTDVTPTTASIGTPVQSLCTGSAGGVTSVALTGNTPTIGTGTWTVASQPLGSGAVTFTGTDLHTPTATAGNLVAGTYVLNWTIANLATACNTVAIDTLKVYYPPSTAVSGSSNSFCLFAPVTLAATAPTTGAGIWSVVSVPAGAGTPVFTTPSSATSTVSGLVLGAYTFRWTTSNGPCTTSTSDVVITITDCQIAMSKEAATPVPQPDGSFNVTFKFHIMNTGGITVTNIQAQDDLTTTFPSPKIFSIVSINNTTATGLTVNSGFNGNSDTNLLTAASSSLTAGTEDIVTVVVNVKLH